MTQRQVAEAMGKPPSWIARIETKERRMDVLEFVAIARALGMREGDLWRQVTSALPRKLDI